MKKIAVVLFALAVVAFAVSCSTTQASDVEPVVREVKISDYTAKEYSPDQIYQMLERFAQDCYGDDDDVMITKDKDARRIDIAGLEFSSTVGALADDGWVVVDLRLEAKEDTAVITMLFVDAYSIMRIGPIETQKSQGITEYGLATLDYQAQYAADQFQYAVSNYAYYIDNGLI